MANTPMAAWPYVCAWESKCLSYDPERPECYVASCDLRDFEGRAGGVSARDDDGDHAHQGHKLLWWGEGGRCEKGKGS